MTALRRRVSISAIGSVICCSRYFLLFTSYFLLFTFYLPAALRHTGDIALQRKLAEAEAAQRELAQVRPRTAAQVASIAEADLVFRRLVFFRDLCCRGHLLSALCSNLR